MPVPHWLLAMGLMTALAVPLAAPARADVADGVTKWRAGDYAGAVAEWRGPADAGDRDAQFNMGQAYKLGRGVPADPARAIEYYRKALAQGHEAAEANLGWLLFQQDRREEALPYLQRAAANGDERSQYLLGIAYFNGDVVAKDWPRAYRLMTAAAASGLPQARDALSEMDARIPLAERQKALATKDKTLPLRSTPAPRTAAAATVKAAPPPAAPVRQSATSLSKQPVAVAGGQTPKAQTSGAQAWRVQLGAFGSQAAASSEWARITRKVGPFATLDPVFVANGGMVRLQAGPLADRSAASTLCSKAAEAGVACFPVRSGTP